MNVDAFELPYCGTTGLVCTWLAHEQHSSRKGRPMFENIGFLCTGHRCAVQYLLRIRRGGAYGGHGGRQGGLSPRCHAHWRHAAGRDAAVAERKVAAGCVCSQSPGKQNFRPSSFDFMQGPGTELLAVLMTGCPTASFRPPACLCNPVANPGINMVCTDLAQER